VNRESCAGSLAVQSAEKNLAKINQKEGDTEFSIELNGINFI